jgi:hypothetical protein
MKPTPAIVQTVEAEASLAELARQIAGAHADALAAARTSVEHARRCGELLLKVKARLPHGRFLPWVEGNCPFSQRTGTNYMRVARDWEKLQATLGADDPPTIAGALQVLAEPKEANRQPAADLDAGALTPGAGAGTNRGICDPDLSAPSRHRLCAYYPELFVNYGLVMAARGWGVEQIAAGAGVSIHRVELLLCPAPPPRDLAAARVPPAWRPAYFSCVMADAHHFLWARTLASVPSTAERMGWAEEAAALERSSKAHREEAEAHCKAANWDHLMTTMTTPHDDKFWFTLRCCAGDDAGAALGMWEPEQPFGRLMARIGRHW